MLEAFAVPIGFHGSEEQTGGVLHYEFNETLFMFNPFSKHFKEASMAEGMPIVYPDTPVGRKVFPWRYGAENIEANSDWHQEDAATDRKWNGWTQNWDNFLTRERWRRFLDLVPLAVSLISIAAQATLCPRHQEHGSGQTRRSASLARTRETSPSTSQMSAWSARTWRPLRWRIFADMVLLGEARRWLQTR